MRSTGKWSMAGKTVLITGAARGIGAETARRLHQKGANVSLVGIEPHLLADLVAERLKSSTRNDAKQRDATCGNSERC